MHSYVVLHYYITLHFISLHHFLFNITFLFSFLFSFLFITFFYIFLGIPRGSTFSSPGLSRNALLNTCDIAKLGNAEYVQTHVLDRTVRTLEYVLKHFNKDSYVVVKNNNNNNSNSNSNNESISTSTKNAQKNTNNKNNKDDEYLVENSIMHQECSLQNLNVDLFSLLLETMVHQRTINQVLKIAIIQLIKDIVNTIFDINICYKATKY